MTVKMNIYQKIQAVSNRIKNIEKNITIGSESYGYKAIQDKDVILAVKKAESEFGLISIPVKQDMIKSEIVKVQKERGGEGIYYMDIIKMTLRIIDLDNPESFIEVESYGRGLDPGDKGFGKASTYARKYALLNAYKIATGEDPDDKKSKEQKAVSKDEKREIVIDFMMRDNVFCQNLLRYFNIGSVDELSTEQVEQTYKDLKKKGRL